METVHEQFMLRALELAGRGLGDVEPNPMVGAVIVRDGQAVAEGWHEQYGGPHAERNALADAAARGVDLRGATMYVTLEPCCHTGKTPPCTEAVLKAGIGTVVVAMTDPDNKVAGRGLDLLRQAGVNVVTDVCETQARELLAAYIKLRTRRRPWVIAKWAQTSDGYLALPPEQGRWVTGTEAREEVHRIRSWCDGILVGIGTVLADDPMLNNRSGDGRQPVRVVLDTRLRTPLDSALVRTAGEYPTVIVAAETRVAEHPDRVAEFTQAGCEVWPVPQAGRGISLDSLLSRMGERNWTYLLVEGGAEVLRSVIEQNHADELRVFTSRHRVGDRQGLPRCHIEDVLQSGRFVEAGSEGFGPDRLQRFLTVRG